MATVTLPIPDEEYKKKAAEKLSRAWVNSFLYGDHSDNYRGYYKIFCSWADLGVDEKRRLDGLRDELKKTQSMEVAMELWGEINTIRLTKDTTITYNNNLNTDASMHAKIRDKMLQRIKNARTEDDAEAVSREMLIRYINFYYADPDDPSEYGPLYYFFVSAQNEMVRAHSQDKFIGSASKLSGFIEKLTRNLPASRELFENEIEESEEEIKARLLNRGKILRLRGDIMEWAYLDKVAYFAYTQYILAPGPKNISPPPLSAPLLEEIKKVEDAKLVGSEEGKRPKRKLRRRRSDYSYSEEDEDETDEEKDSQVHEVEDEIVAEKHKHTRENNMPGGNKQDVVYDIPKDMYEVLDDEPQRTRLLLGSGDEREGQTAQRTAYEESLQKAANALANDGSSITSRIGQKLYGDRIREATEFIYHQAIDDAIAAFRAEQTVLDIETQNAIIIGDIHGDIDTFRRIFSQYPPKDYTYLLLGDYVDRGKHSVELLALLLANKIIYKDKFIMLRGDHESTGISHQTFPFEVDEFLNDGGRIAERIYGELFPQLPLAVVLNKDIFLVHGGIPVNASSNYRISLESMKGVGKHYNLGDDSIANQMVWNDFSENKEDRDNRRGEGIGMVGKDSVNSFLNDNGMKLIIRGHQHANGGYNADKTVLTLLTGTAYPGDVPTIAKIANGVLSTEPV